MSSVSHLLKERDVTEKHHQEEEESVNFVEVMSGLAVCISRSDAPSTPCTFPGDSEYVHLNCLLQGEFKARVRNINIHLREGEVTIGFSDGEEFHMPRPTEFCNLAVMITPKLLQEIAGEQLLQDSWWSDTSFFVKAVGKNPKIVSAALNIATLMNESPQRKLLLHAAVLSYIHWSLEACNDPVCHCSFNNREKHQLEAAKRYLLRDLSEPPTIAEIASLVGLNQCKLKRGFKILFNTSIYACFQQERMKKALELLRQSNVTETAVTLGYSNVSHFSAAFKKQFSILPKDARRELLANGENKSALP
ncbi:MULTISPECIES: helix-turn-helix transcriptional regulator [Grimontia]|uniref:Regulatory protein PchR n=1 Tax=Grimontia marina TaxID=646534 RepID=A0A128F814_9GAMM|nr:MULTISPECIES: AraC family transcriptional regulator [Grimontia]WRV98142.1 AraC family transcriptional regulator [Grimontia sp. NTOU-MAR1]CZF82441.1 Regulatory protein PchR [Grimontia marina]